MTPWESLASCAPCVKRYKSEWACKSMKPGHRYRPVQSTTRVLASAVEGLRVGEMAQMVPSETSREDLYGGSDGSPEMIVGLTNRVSPVQCSGMVR